MPNRIVVSELGGPEVLKYENYDLPKNIGENILKKTINELNKFINNESSETILYIQQYDSNDMYLIIVYFFHRNKQCDCYYVSYLLECR